jgi:sulfur-oxidizing protein SoxY
MPFVLRAPLQAAILALALAVPAAAQDAAPAPGRSWDDITHALYGDRALLETGIVTLEAPERAHDAALVPVTIRLALPDGDSRRIERVTLVVDENPAPVAGTFTIGADAGVDAITTRIRIETYSHVHAVAELSDGTLHSAARYVKAAGGCAAPMNKDAAEAIASMGQIRYRDLGATLDGGREAQVMVRHPNNSGFQRDQITLYYIPAHFVTEMRIRQGDDLLLAVEGGISLSEDPTLRFDYDPDGRPLSLEVADTEGNRFREEWPAAGS